MGDENSRGSFTGLGCKKIRDERGDWGPGENYIRSHSEAEFAHGICPE